MNQLTAIFLGPQGSGKGTQIDLLKDFLLKNDPQRAVVHFEMGAGLRAFAEEGGYTQGLLDASIKRGELQPSFITTYTIARFFIEQVRGNEHIIIDGYPRSLEQLVDFNSLMLFYGRKKPIVFWIEISDETAVARLLKRGRNDDTETSIRNRLRWSREQSAAVLEKFRSAGNCSVVTVNGDRPIEEVHRDVIRAITSEG
ncbi:hypothetical protein A3D66_02815 [Candidatus Kaiserbacteria bacterium RIFCSPHIGHO2_02_FULL_50_9]|uniref:Adenylate kinase n=1 Tax=Candidatus Kaiserbacteria bacterium RIFCSPLOWO2_01_FULL_51_21 TaxID=1798508 RepID=A0A1F6ECP1_9BACT|nr:MAG: hypothetical protein A2761_01195 [Candidatus Kaiserbacteria bacterium RIFCSPHIGHO2_01_FULL_51_33]OGG63348.1 MAG: hypothetical protein A3D66_02815 [Candidatus Kaiserbacteria bacterium RIFCSPHIGHO2_02_FULL_50_9]OGG71377.1 MAG: hypothetical protein A3A35_01350 [Candidatus Kaiserbacteria bacterium RIFCSPLOWO2_01_FULL_51_21]